MESSAVNRRAAGSVPSAADWARLRTTITELYRDRRWTMDRVRDYMIALGYRVNTRMVRTRITGWSLHRNHQLKDMTAALRLLDPDPAMWPSPEPIFLIRQQQVTVNEVLRFFKRRGIKDPIQWAQSVPPDLEEPQVTLLNSDTESAGESTGGPGQTMLSSSSQSPSAQTPRPPMQILTPEHKAVGTLYAYSAGYVGLGNVAAHQEPQVHHFTVHGRFGDRMQEGLAQMMRNGSGAFPNFRRGFALVQSLLSDCHPMGLAQYLAVVCELAARGANSILYSLLRYTASMASSLRVPDSLAEFLLAIYSSQDVLGTAILSLRAALAVFTEQLPSDWQRLYIQERLCDCLYHGKERIEGSGYRARLLLDQEAFYGPFARNVLWTLTNVADDQLVLGNVDGAEEHYTTALERAEHLAGFGRAKTRFAALEGLARIEQMRFEQMRQSPGDLVQDVAGPHLQNAYRYIDEACGEALTWFDSSSRRVSRVREERGRIVNLLAHIGHETPPGCNSHDVELHAVSMEYDSASPHYQP